MRAKQYFANICSASLAMCLLAGTLATAQTTKADARCKKNPSATGCPEAKPPAANNNAAPAGANFPFPLEDSKGSAPETASPKKGSDLPAMPTSGVPDPPASSERPMNLPRDGGGASSSSAGDADDGSGGVSSSRSAVDDDVAPTAAPADAPIKSSALKDLGSRADSSVARLKLEQTRVADDLKVGSFYMRDGNVQGAYLRFKDAADRAPDDPDVRFNLAEAASRLNKRDEAALNYREYLKLDPGGDHDKATRKALGKLGTPEVQK